MKDLSATKSGLDMFSNSFKFFTITLIIGVVAASTYGMYAVGGDWKTTLLGSVFGIVFLSLSVITGLRLGKGILTAKEQADIAILENSKIIKVINKIVPKKVNILFLLRFVVVMANIVRWGFFWISLLGMSLALMFNGLSGPFFGMCFLAILWLPLFDGLFFKKSIYIVISFVKFVVTICVFTLFAAMHL
jgi:hypothetical protein